MTMSTVCPNGYESPVASDCQASAEAAFAWAKATGLIDTDQTMGNQQVSCGASDTASHCVNNVPPGCSIQLKSTGWNGGGSPSCNGCDNSAFYSHKASSGNNGHYASVCATVCRPGFHVTGISHSNNINGIYFNFLQADFEVAFPLIPSLVGEGNKQYFNVVQCRVAQVVWAGRIQAVIDTSNGPHGRRDSDYADNDFAVGDVLRPEGSRCCESGAIVSHRML